MIAQTSFETNDKLFYGRVRQSVPNPLVPQIPDYIFDETDQTRRFATIAFTNKHNIILFGETGNGKTEHIKWMCSELGLPLYQVQGRSDLTYDDLTGDWKPNTDPAIKAPFVFSEGSLALAVRDGGVFLLDEAASVKQGVLNGLNELLNNKDLVINTDRGHRVIPRHPDFQVAMTFNPPDRYSGNQELNLAFLNRFFPFEWEYLSTVQETALLKKRFPSNDKTFEGFIRSLANFAEEVRAYKSSSENARYVMSHRDSIKVCELVQMGANPAQAISMAILSVVKLVAADEYNAIRGMATQRFGTL